MAQAVYSATFLETASTAGDQAIAAPAGYLWIVREIYITQATIVPVEYSVTGNNGQRLFGGTLALAGDTDSYLDRHIIVLHGGNLAVHTLLAEIDLSIYGYQLTLP